MSGERGPNDVVLVVPSTMITVTTLHPTEIVLRGGFLVDPLLVTDLLMIDDKKFITLQKWTPALSLFLTGKTAKTLPLRGARIFEAMHKRVKVTVTEMTAAFQGQKMELLSALIRLRPTVR